MKLYIENMVSNRCKMIVKTELNKLGLHFIFVKLGEVEIEEMLDKVQSSQLNHNLKELGLGLSENKKSVIIESIKNRIVELVHYSDKRLKINLSYYLSEKLKYDYTYLANLFSQNQGITIEQFFLNHKIERVKEFLVYNEISLTEIADKLQYSSVAHLSTQFKKMTGLTPSAYKNLRLKKRKTLDNV